MIIKRLKASFGRLSGAELQLEPGLNIIAAPNETGKSTWSSFIKAMLYGVDSSERDKLGYIAEKNRFRPWDGAPMEGALEAECWGRPVRVTRESVNASAPMRKFSAVFADTGDEIENITGESAGLRLIGVEQQVFERSCFVRQTGLGFGQSAELERRIQMLMNSGDEETAYSEADQRLREWMRKIKYNNSGELPRAEARLAELRRREERQRSLNCESGELRSRILRLEGVREELLREVELHEKRDSAADVRKRYEAYASRNEAKQAKAQADAAFEKYKKMPSKGVMTEVLENLKGLGPVRDRVNQLENNLGEALKEEQRTLEQRDMDRFFSGKTADEAWETAEKTSASATQLSSKSKVKVGNILICWGVLAIVAALAYFYIVTPISYVLMGVCAVAAAVYTAVSVTLGKRAAGELKALLGEFEGETPEGIMKAAALYREIYGEHERAAAKVPELEAALSEEQEKLDGMRKAVLNTMRELSPEIEDEAQANSEASEAISLIEAQSKAGAELRETERICRVVGEYRQEPLVDINSLEKPAMEKEKAVTELAETRAQLEQSAKALATQSGMILEIGDPAEIAAEISELSERQADLALRYQALEGAVDVLKSANADIRARFSPVLNQKAGEILSGITRGRYATVMFNSNFEAEALSEDDVVARKAGMLSTGTVEQIYLALRLAVSELVLPEGTNPPLILDDVLAYFDDDRMEAALDWLRKISRDRQVVLFSCQNREAEYLKGREGVNIIGTQIN